jgi:hypothetical protein
MFLFYCLEQFVKEFLDRAGPRDAELLGPGLGPRQNDVRAGDRVEILERLARFKVYPTDMAATDDADLRLLHRNPFRRSGARTCRFHRHRACHGAALASRAD